MIHQTERLLLRPWTEADAPALFRLASDPLVGPATGWKPHRDEAESLKTIRDILSAPETYAVLLRETGEIIGDISLMIGPENSSLAKDGEAELGFWLGSGCWGHGYIPEAARALIRYAFTACGVHTIWGGYFEGNEKSRRAQEKCGLRYVQTLPERLWAPLGVNVTEHVCRLTRGEWEAAALASVQEQQA